MNIISIYSRGESNERTDRLAIAGMRKLGFPADYVDFMAKYGAGEFACELRLWNPTKLLPYLACYARGMLDPIDIANMDSGTLRIADHVGKLLFEFVPRTNVDGEPKVFSSFEEVLSWILSRGTQSPFPLYNQYLLCSFLLGSKSALKRKDDTKIRHRLLEVLNCDDLAIGRWDDIFYAIAPLQGWQLSIDDGDRARINYDIGSKIVPLIRLLGEFGFKHIRNEEEELMRLLVSGDSE